MKRFTAILAIFLLAAGIGGAALADGEESSDGWTVITEINEAGNEVISAVDQDGNVFSVEDLPEFDDGSLRPGDAEADNGAARSADDETIGDTETGAGTAVWAGVVLAVVVIGAAVYITLKRKKQPQA